MTAIREAIAGRSAAALRVAAHTLKGAVQHFGARQAFEHSFALSG